jgi:hypothetical protein
MAMQSGAAVKKHLLGFDWKGRPRVWGAFRLEASAIRIYWKPKTSGDPNFGRKLSALGGKNEAVGLNE